MENSIHISVLNKGYYSSSQVWAQLQLVSIESKTNVDNGFIAIEVDEKHLKQTIDIVKNYLGERLRSLQYHKDYNSAIEYREAYWRLKENGQLKYA